jgi:hypothetical protein
LTEHAPAPFQRRFFYTATLKNFEYVKEAAQIFVFGARDVLRDTARSEDQKCAAKLTQADAKFLSESSINVKPLYIFP